MKPRTKGRRAALPAATVVGLASVVAAARCGSSEPTAPPERPAVAQERALDDVCQAAMPRVLVSPVAKPEAGGAELQLRWLDRGATDPSVVRWRGDLNGDGRDDLITRVKDACGNWGECWFHVLIDCGDGQTWGYVLPRERDPVYAFDLGVAETLTVVGGRAWVDLVETERLGPDLERVDAREPPPLEHRLRFDGLVYRRSETTQPGAM